MNIWHLKNAVLEHFRSIKAESFSVVTLLKTLEPTQFLLNKARLRPRWLLRKLWMSSQGYQTVKDKQQIRYQPAPKWSSMEDAAVPLERNLHGHPLAGLLWERQFEEIYENLDGKKCLFTRNENYSCRYTLTTSKNGWMERSRKWHPCGRN